MSEEEIGESSGPASEVWVLARLLRLGGAATINRCHTGRVSASRTCQTRGGGG